MGIAVRSFLHRLLNPLITLGTVRIAVGDGRPVTIGDGRGRVLAIRFTTRSALLRVLLDPELKLGEAYVDGTLIMESGPIDDLLAILCRAPRRKRPVIRAMSLARYLCRGLQQWNLRERARRNAAHHYDLDGNLYDIFLDEDRQYSCAYFESHGQCLDDAQLAKKRHIAAKLLLRPGQHVLDIGSGWGGLALYVAGVCQASVTGVTLSAEQLRLSRQRAVEEGLSERVHFHLRDYRDITGTFDRVVSVGMFEHVGAIHYEAFFRKCGELLTEDGIMLLHSIGRSRGPAPPNPWIAKYIFPGGYIPSLSEVLPAIERAGLMVTDIEVLRLHYAETLRAWRERFLQHRVHASRLYGERFVRLWEFYLASSELAFRTGAMMVFQIQIAKRQDVVPVTRDYVERNEGLLRQMEGNSDAALRLAGE